MRDQRTDQRVRDRGGDDTLPSLTAVLEVGRDAEAPAPNLLSSFANAKQSPHTPVPDLMSAFGRAAGGRDASDAEEGSQHSGLDGYAARTTRPGAAPTPARRRSADGLAPIIGIMIGISGDAISMMIIAAIIGAE